MVQKQTLILSDTPSFLSLLKLRHRLAESEPGDLVEVRLNDQDTVTDLERIVNRSEDRIVEIRQEESLFIISIIRGNKID